ncbi:TPA: hypothetical protein N0F65_009780 [Lagenidium giganteum]|uniref:Uncharacterized protein n=1 Tax=Lagenidium giganteum TaxID=4803 RepID=A0AAV2YWE5_9STRA|nr:TPA: hypothetical protein N0F65_009780 [Lagenidium giganteum]
MSWRHSKSSTPPWCNGLRRQR